MKEREGKEGRRLKLILFNDFKIMLIECNGRNVLSQVMEIIDLIIISLSLSLSLSLCLSLSVFLSLLSLLLLFSHFFFPPLSLSPPLGDGDYICAGSHRQHELYIWDKATGNLVKILTGPKGESLLDLTWHPVKPVILSVSNGLVNVMVTCSG